MHGWALWAIHLLLSTGIVAGYTVYYEYLWHRGGRLAQWGLPLSNAALALFCGLCAFVYPDTQRFYLNIAFFALVIALLDPHIGLRGYAVRVLELLSYIFLSAVLPIAPTAWHWVLLGFVVGIIWLWFGRAYVAAHLPAALCLAVFFWAIYWQPQVNAPVAATFRVLLTFMALVVEHRWLWAIAARRDADAKRLKREADHDRLTHAFSYARFRQDLAAAMAQGRFNLLMFDLDFFKSVNDEYGHAAGDTVLKETAALVATLCTANGATLYRTGGEEFSILAPATLALPDFARTLWQTVRAHRFTIATRPLTLSASVGATAGGAAEHTVLDVIRRADSNLYLSKRRGRDAVTVDGHTLAAAETQTLVRLFAYYTTPVVDLQTKRTVANRLAVSRFDQHNGTWCDDIGAGFNVATLIAILKVNDQLLNESPALSLTPAQFIAPEAIAQLIAYDQARTQAAHLTLILTAYPVLADFRAASKRYHRAGIRVVIALDRFLPYHEARQVSAWLPYYDELEINLDTLAPNFTKPDFAEALQAWQTRLQQAGKNLIVSGIDNRNDVQTMNHLGIRYGRGRYFAEPTLPRM